MGKAWLQPHICPSPNQCDPSPCVRSRTAVSGCFRWGPVAACHWLWFSRWGPGVRPTHCKMGQWISMTLPNVVEKGNRRFDRSWGKLGNLMLSTESEPLCHWISKKIRPENLVFDVEKAGNYRTLHISLEKPWFAAGFLKIFHKIPWLKKSIPQEDFDRLWRGPITDVPWKIWGSLEGRKTTDHTLMIY